MARKKSRRKPLGTIWEVPDELWKWIEPIFRLVLAATPSWRISLATSSAWIRGLP